MDIVNINVGGTMFSTRFSTLKAIPDTRLGKLSTSSEEYIKEKDCFFFDRNPDLFQCLLDLYRHGNLHVPNNICGATLTRELGFWQIPLNKIPNCCLAVICKHEEAMASTEKLKLHFAAEEDESAKGNDSKQSTVAIVRHMLWLFMTSRNSSLAAKVYNIFYYIMVSLSVMIFVLETHPSFREPIQSITELLETYDNITLIELVDMLSKMYDIGDVKSNPKMVMYLTTFIKTPLKILDNICMIFFAVELILRMLCSPSVLKFFKSFLNWLDIIVTAALITAFVLEFDESLMLRSIAVFWLYCVCKGMVILRIIRLFRLTRDVKGIGILTVAMKSSVKQLLMLGASVLVALVLFSSVMYFVEMHKGDSSFVTVPYTIWWSIITVTTVGYGDATPSTAAGYIIGSLCAVCGILLVAMPIAIVASSFADLTFLDRVRELEVEMERDLKTIKSGESLQTNLVVNKIHVQSVN